MGKTAVFIVAFVWLFSAAKAQGADVKIGYVDLQRAMREVNEGSAALEQLTREFKDKQVILDKEKAELEQKQQEYEKQKTLMNQAARDEKEKELRERFMKWQEHGMALQNELDRRQGELTRGILMKIEELLNETGKSGGFTIILLKDSLLYAPLHMDLTNELIRKYNDKYGKPSAK